MITKPEHTKVTFYQLYPPLGLNLPSSAGKTEPKHCLTRFPDTMIGIVKFPTLHIRHNKNF